MFIQVIDKSFRVRSSECLIGYSTERGASPNVS